MSGEGKMRVFIALLLASCACSSHVETRMLNGSFTDQLEDELRVGGEGEFSVATYNIHSGFGFDRRLLVSRAEVLDNLRGIVDVVLKATPTRSPEVLVLNEVDFQAQRTANVNEAAVIADELSIVSGFQYRVIKQYTWVNRFPGYHIRFGNAVLTRVPVVAIYTCSLDGVSECVNGEVDEAERVWDLNTERRGLLKLTIEVGGHELDLLATHLDNKSATERERQAFQILATIRPDRPTLLLGDLNTEPGYRAYNLLTSTVLIDTRALWSARSLGSDLHLYATCPSNATNQYIDHVLATSDFLPTYFAAFGGLQSDHLGLVASYKFSTPQQKTILQTRQQRYR